MFQRRSTASASLLSTRRRLLDDDLTVRVVVANDQHAQAAQVFCVRLLYSLRP